MANGVSRFMFAAGKRFMRRKARFIAVRKKTVFPAGKTIFFLTA